VEPRSWLERARTMSRSVTLVGLLALMLGLLPATSASAACGQACDDDYSSAIDDCKLMHGDDPADADDLAMCIQTARDDYRSCLDNCSSDASPSPGQGHHVAVEEAMSRTSFDEARILAEGRRQVAQAEAEAVFNATMAKARRARQARYEATLAELDQAKATMDQSSPEFAAVRDRHEAAKRPAETRPIFEARVASYTAADREYQAAIHAVGAKHRVLTGATPGARGSSPE
jgi:hypothetical protein